MAALQDIPPPVVSAAAAKAKPQDDHPSGKARHGSAIQILRMVSFAIYFTICVTVIHASQVIGSPLYLVNPEWYYAYMSKTKEWFALVVTTMTHWWGPTVIRFSGDADVADQIRINRDGMVECDFPDRMVMIANHQIYTDWLYLWWVGYTNVRKMHGHLYIILKESLKRIPIIGPGMMFFGFIFMSRKMATDKPRMAHRLRKLREVHVDSRGRKYLSPMWLLLFPEGTNLSGNGRKKSAQWAAKTGINDLDHMLLPRSTGLFFCLNELRGSIEYVYDCTVAYEGVPRGGFGEEYFTLTSTYFQGRPPKSVNFYWRRFKVDDIPLDDIEKFDAWLRCRWVEKDKLMEEYLQKNRFPASKVGRPFIETEVRTKHSVEFLQVFSVVTLAYIFVKWVYQVLAIIRWIPPLRWIL